MKPYKGCPMLRSLKPHKTENTLNSKTKPSRLKIFLSRLRAIEEAYDYDPAEGLIKSQIDMRKQIALLEVRVLNLEKPRT